MTVESVAIVGSFRKHYEEVVRVARVFQSASMAVTSPSVSIIINAGAKFVRFATDSPASADHAIQDVTIEKILGSDLVYVVAPDGYIGRTTSYELGLVRVHGIPTYFSARPRDLPIYVPDDHIATPEELVERLQTIDQPARVARTHIRGTARVAADVVILTIRDNRLNVLLVIRGVSPFRGKLALPGGFLLENESLEEAAYRELAEETGLRRPVVQLRQIGTYSTVGRDPRGRVVTTAYLAIAPNLPTPVGGTDARRADWVEVEPSLKDQLAFDHWLILSDALEHARRLLEYMPIAADFCGELFTISELRNVYEIVWDLQLDPGNFRRKVVEIISGFVEATGRKRSNGRGRPADLYRRGPVELLHPPMIRTPGHSYNLKRSHADR